MSFKVVLKDGKVIAWGPNDDNYAPSVPDGATLDILESVPTDPNASINAEIARLEAIQVAKMTPRADREYRLGVLTALGLSANLNPATAELATIQAQIVALRAQRV